MNTTTVPIFVLLYRPGPAWLAGRDVFQQPLAEHRRYMGELHANGTLVFAGPFLDASGGLVALRATDADAALALRDADPAVRDAVMLAGVHPWLPLAGI